MKGGDRPPNEREDAEAYCTYLGAPDSRAYCDACSGDLCQVEDSPLEAAGCHLHLQRDPRPEQGIV